MARNSKDALVEELRLMKKIVKGTDLVFDMMVGKERRLLSPKKGQEHSPETLFNLRQIHQIEGLVERVLYIKSEGPYVVIFFINGPEERALWLRVNISKIDDHFPDKSLLRVGRSYLINPSYVRTVRKFKHPDFEILLQSSPNHKVNLPVGRTYLKALKESHLDWFEDDPH